jgi:hypothetical protein
MREHTYLFKISRVIGERLSGTLVSDLEIPFGSRRIAGAENELGKPESWHLA